MAALPVACQGRDAHPPMSAAGMMSVSRATSQGQTVQVDMPSLQSQHEKSSLLR
jgi:hypothetical protein